MLHSHIGEVPEWLIGAVSKTVVSLRGTVGSNPTLSATERRPKACAFFFLCKPCPDLCFG